MMAASNPSGGAAGLVVFTAQDARWLGHEAAKRGKQARGRAFVPENLLAEYDEGTRLSGFPPVRPGVLDENARRRIKRCLDGDEESDSRRKVPPLDVAIKRLVQRADVGTATRYDVLLEFGDKAVQLRDLRASDLLAFDRIRPIAFDARLVLPPLRKGQGEMWVAEVERAMEKVETIEMEPEGSEAMEIRELLYSLTISSRPWTWAEDDPFPRGIARISHDDRYGWVRGTLMHEIRSEMGRVSRVALHRACLSLGWTNADWRIETAYLRVWSVKASDWKIADEGGKDGNDRSLGLW